VTAPKRPLQTPQREWLQGPLNLWATGLVEETLRRCGPWFDDAAVRASLDSYRNDGGESSVHIWQWLSLALMEPAGRFI
jgi:asparagine synthase (glutamine-hydrolysing)